MYRSSGEVARDVSTSQRTQLSHLLPAALGRSRQGCFRWGKTCKGCNEIGISQGIAAKRSATSGTNQLAGLPACVFLVVFYAKQVTKMHRFRARSMERTDSQTDGLWCPLLLKHKISDVSNSINKGAAAIIQAFACSPVAQINQHKSDTTEQCIPFTHYFAPIRVRSFELGVIARLSVCSRPHFNNQLPIFRQIFDPCCQLVWS